MKWEINLALINLKLKIQLSTQTDPRSLCGRCFWLRPDQSSHNVLQTCCWIKNWAGQYNKNQPFHGPLLFFLCGGLEQQPELLLSFHLVSAARWPDLTPGLGGQSERGSHAGSPALSYLQSIQWGCSESRRPSACVQRYWRVQRHRRSHRWLVFCSCHNEGQSTTGVQASRCPQCPT